MRTKKQLLYQMLQGSIFKNKTHMLYWDEDNECIMLSSLTNVNNNKTLEIKELKPNIFEECFGLPYIAKTSQHSLLAYNIDTHKYIAVYDFLIKDENISPENIFYKATTISHGDEGIYKATDICITSYKIYDY